MDSNSGKGCLKAYLVKNEVWHIADIDYELRVDYRKYLKSTYSDSAVRSYLRGMDKAKLYAIQIRQSQKDMTAKLPLIN